MVGHDFDNSTEGIKMKRGRDEYDGAGPSDEGSSNDVPHSKRIERQRMYGPMLTLIVRILMKGLIRHCYMDSVASY